MCFQEHLLKPAALVKHVILEEFTSIGDILSQKQSGLYFVCTGEYDPKEKKFYLLSAKHPKSLHQLSCVEETFKCGATRMIFVAQYSRAVEKSIRNFAVSLLRRSTPSAKKAVFSRITAPLSFLFIVLNDAVNNGHAIYDNWFSGSLSPSFKHKWFFPDLTHFAPVCGNLDLSFVYDEMKKVSVLPRYEHICFSGCACVFYDTARGDFYFKFETTTLVKLNPNWNAEDATSAKYAAGASSVTIPIGTMQDRDPRPKLFNVWNYYDRDPAKDLWTVKVRTGMDKELHAREVHRQRGKRRISSILSERGRKFCRVRPFDIVRE